MTSAGSVFEFKNISIIENIKEKPYLRSLIPKLSQREGPANCFKVFGLTQCLYKRDIQLKYIFSTILSFLMNFLN